MNLKDKKIPHKHKPNKKKARNTIILSAVLVIIFAVAAILFGVSMPRTNTIKDVGGEDIATSALFDGDDGKSYFIASKNKLEEHDMETDALLQSVDYYSDISKALDENDYPLVDGNLNQFYFLYVNEEKTNDFLLVQDNRGNLFKYEKDDTGLVFSSDCLIRDSSYELKKMSFSNDELYIIYNINNRYVLEEYDINSLSSGAKKSKYLWYVSKADNEAYTLSMLPVSTKIWDIASDGDYVYVATSTGIIKIDKQFYDYDDFSYFETAEKTFDELYQSSLKTYLLSLSDEEKETYHLTDEAIEAMNEVELEEAYRSASGKGTLPLKNQVAATFVEETPWCNEFSVSQFKLVIPVEYFDSEKISIAIPGLTINPVGIVYSPKNRSFYIASLYDDHLHEAKVDDVNQIVLQSDTTLDDITSVIDISFGGKTFHSSSALAYNKNANTLYVAFASQNQVTVVDINNGANKELFTFEAGFDIQVFVGDSKNSVLHYLTTETITDTSNQVSLHNYVWTVMPEKSVHKGVIRAGLIVFICLGVAALAVMIASLFIFAHKGTSLRFKYIGKDLKKNKWTYVALLPFVVAIILFCYYEAIGSISLSFLDYTKLDPKMKWNNFANYIRIFHESNFWLSVGNTLFFIVFDVILAIIPPVIFAFFLSVMKSKKYSSFVRTALFIPGIIPGVASMLIWRIGIYGQTGILNTMITALGGQTVAWLENTSISRWSLIFMGFPFVGSYLIFYGGMMNIPKDYYEAAELEGAGIWRRFFKIDLPLIKPQMMYVFVTTVINSAQNYARTYMLRSAGTVTLAEQMYTSMTGGNYGLAAAYATLIFLILMAAIIVNFRNQKKSYSGDVV